MLGSLTFTLRILRARSGLPVLFVLLVAAGVAVTTTVRSPLSVRTAKVVKTDTTMFNPMKRPHRLVCIDHSR